ncbi:MAG TPA: copper resistance protein CopC, partial [Burkholderiales bacterium]|nr:copper resistance protein CopC [Burkholderiales bacterium]
MLRRFSALALKLVALLALGALPLLARAHAMLERSDPAAGIVVAAERAPRVLSLWFTEPVGVTSNAIAVVNSENRRVDRLNARNAVSNPTRVDVDLNELSDGAYLVRWRVTSADDHVVRGSYWFVVGFAATPPPSAELLGSGPTRVSFLEVAARWLGLISILFMAGAPLFRLALRLREEYGRKTWATIAAIFVVAHCMLALAHAQGVAELPLPQALAAPVLREVLLDSRFAVLWWTRLALGLTLAILLCRRSTRLAALFAVPLLIATSLGSHAAGARVSPALAVALDSVHLAAAALWLGGLLELSRLPVAVLGSLVSRVSALFLPAVLILIASGVFNAWEQVGTFSRLLSTAHGQSLVVKLALLLPLLLIAAVNLLVVRPRGHFFPWQRRFRIHVRAEAVLVVLILLPVAVLATLAPAAQQMFPQPLDVARQAGDLRIALRVDPAWVGVSRFHVEIADSEGRPPPDIRRVVLTFTMEGMNMGRTNVTLSPRGPGVYEAEGFYVGMPGISQIGVAVNRDGGDRTAVFRMEVPDINAS